MKRKKIGIIGGGQLALMLIEAAIPWNIPCNILDSEGCSASPLADTHIKGSLYDKKAIQALAECSDILTFETEHFDVEAVIELVKTNQIECIPSPEILYTIQNKHRQKQFFEKHNLPTAPFVSVQSPKEWIKAAQELGTDIFVAKLHTGGYDGKGVLVCEKNNIQQVFDAPCIIEKYIPRKHEIAVIVARNRKKEVVTYPVVEMVFDEEANILKYLICPARIDKNLSTKAQSLAAQAVEYLNGIGIFAVEMFVAQDNTLLLNEIAPRPHNSGHHTIESCYTSQYEQLLRIILDLPLGSTDLIQPAVMLNLLGEKGYQGVPYYEGIDEALLIEGVYVHLYNKSQTRSLRKMGHVTIIDKDIQTAIQKAQQINIKVKAKQN
ncbi:MAG: 5-(carboxyamino)imidazole ribonucleotide synthase [Bacteroidia bacterium]|nr:5-(carboxyamino)imidazole ribonucleotide synthase [Bacteroidia bacterium]MDW8302153.1 5-(carboxyamino)imidazole ribonucleotide synthase [Bacteroidia bacterium]